MAGEIGFFRKTFLGGFNKQDVSDYIAKQATEKNDVAKAKDIAEQDAAALAAEATELRLALDMAKQDAKMYKVKALEAAERTIADLEAAIRSMRIEVETKKAGVYAELETVKDKIAGISSIFDNTDEKLEDLKTMLSIEKAEVWGNE